ncbi:hypothetical protein EYF80_029994 [Liparis tanakae]|uniref:Uncharacterized protein n=1 Tax=Liparis tanakae TaxID=230148 RepID=A0A4Z2H209_9TELE|nr:hypothetical protein EYF80_029994 [Liparis tanakae]
MRSAPLGEAAAEQRPARSERAAGVGVSELGLPLRSACFVRRVRDNENGDAVPTSASSQRNSRCDAFIPVPAIADCIPVNGTSVDACCLSLTTPLPRVQHDSYGTSAPDSLTLPHGNYSQGNERKRRRRRREKREVWEETIERKVLKHKGNE